MNKDIILGLLSISLGITILLFIFFNYGINKYTHLNNCKTGDIAIGYIEEYQKNTTTKIWEDTESNILTKCAEVCNNKVSGFTCPCNYCYCNC